MMDSYYAMCQQVPLHEQLARQYKQANDELKDLIKQRDQVDASIDNAKAYVDSTYDNLEKALWELVKL